MSDTSRKRMPFGFLISAAILFAAGVVLAVIGIRIQDAVYAKLDTNTLELTADLSKAGEYKGRFSGVEHFSHGFGVYIEFDEPVSNRSELITLTGGIEGKWVSSDSMLNEDFICRGIQESLSYPEKRFSLLRFSIARPEDGTEVTLTITKPSPALAGKRYKIISAYIPCGLEFARAGMCVLGALALWILALISLAIWAVKAYMHRRASRKTAEAS